MGKKAKEEDYEVRSISAHKGAKGTKTELQYLVQWEGYPDSEDDTWQDESSVSNAPEAVNKYWKSLSTKAQLARYAPNSKDYHKLEDKLSGAGAGGTPKSNGANGGSKKRVAGSPELGSPDVNGAGGAGKKRKSLGAGSGTGEKKVKKVVEQEEEEEEAEAEVEEEGNVEDGDGRKEDNKHMLKAMAKKVDWEDDVHLIETVERTDDGILKLLVIWKDQASYAWVPSKLAREKAPQKIIDFYESHLKFRVKDVDGDEDME